MSIRLTSFMLLVGLALTAPTHGEELPGVWLLDGGTGTAPGPEALNRRLAVGGTGQVPPESAEQIRLGWSWRDPRPEVELYPDAAAGSFVALEATWSLAASNTEFPRLGLGPSDELWLLAPPDRPAQRSGWPDLLHATEAFWRQSTPAPLAEQTIGSLGGCTVRSLPVALDTRLDRWSPAELASRALTDDGEEAGGGNELLRTRRFLWWAEPPAPGEGCAAGSDRDTLRLFPAVSEVADAGDPDDDGNGEPESAPLEHLLTIAEVEWQHLRFSELDPDDWSPGLRRLLATQAPGEAPAGRETTIRTTVAQRQKLLDGRALDLCEIDGLGKLCASNARARRQLYTAVTEPETEIPWPEDVLLRTREACQAVLGGVAANAAACSEAELWQQPIAGGLLAVFSGDTLLNRQPVIRETWHDGTVEWRLDAGDVLTAAPGLELELLDGSVVSIATGDLLDAQARKWASWQWWTLGAGSAMALAALISVLLARRRDPSAPPAGAQVREELERLIESVVDRRLKALAAPGGAPASCQPVPEVPADDPSNDRQVQDLVQRLVAEAVEARLQESANDVARQAAAQKERLTGSAQELTERLQQELKALGEELRGSLRHDAQSLIESLHQDLEAKESPFQRLCQELAELPDGEREPLATALEAAGQLGDWIDRLLPVLDAASGDLESIPQNLPDPAAGEWRRAAQSLGTFSRSDATALRQLAGMVLPTGRGRRSDPAADAPEVAFLEQAGLLAGERSLAERLKRYLAPFDHLGRLGEVTLALQYLVEAYPIEQLSKERRSRLRKELVEIQTGTGQEEDFHPLVARIAAGVGLRYRPVRYYKSRADQSDYAFVRQQVSPISLSERVGFEATADKTLIVRLQRPFYFQRSSGIYYAGHAHVARG